MKKYFFLILIGGLSYHLITSLFSTDYKLIVDTIFIDAILIGVFLVALLRIDYAFFVSLLLLPVFFLLQNLSIISQVYQSQASLSFSFYAIDPRVIGFSLITLFSGLILWKKRASLKTVPNVKTFFLVLGYFCLSVLWSQGDDKYIQLSFYFVLFSLFLTTNILVQNIKSFYRLVSFLIALSLPAILLSYYQIFGGIFYEYSDLDIKRVSGPFDSPNLLGNFLLITIASAIILLFHFQKQKIKKYTWLLLSYLFLAVPIFFMTFSRSAWLGFIIFLGIFSLQKKKLIIVGIFLTLLLIPLLLAFEPTKNRIEGFTNHTMFDSMYARENIWYLSKRKFLEKPFFGYGAGSFPEVINDAKESANGTENPHNDLVFFSVENGLLGVILYLVLIFGFYYQIIKTHLKIKSGKNSDNNSYLIISWGVIAILVAMTVISTVESYYEGNFIHLFTWSLLAGWLAVNNKQLR